MVVVRVVVRAVVVVLVGFVLPAAVGGSGAGGALRFVVLLGAGEVLHRGGEGMLGAVLELEGHLHLVAGQQGRRELHEHEVVPAGLEHELLPGGQREAALLLLHAHAAGAVGGGLVELHVGARGGAGPDQHEVAVGAVADRAEGRGHPLLGGLHPGVGDGERVLGRGGAAAVGGGTLVGGAGLLRIGALPGVGGTGRERQQERGEGGPPRYAGDGP